MIRAASMTATVVALAACVPAGAPPAPPSPPPERNEPPERPAAAEARVVQLPAPRPAWEVRPVTPDARPVRAQSYVVRAGDTLTAIAARTGASADAIARANALPPPYAVRIGQRLAIPAGRYHRVAPGQTGIAIARAYGVPWSQVIAANALREPYSLQAGQRILIPAPPASPAARAAAFRLDIDTILTGGEPATATGRAPAAAVAGARRVLPATTPVARPAAAPGRFDWPVTGGRIARRFGAGASGERFDGVEIAVAAGTPIRASAVGTVAYAGDGIAALGGLVIVRHGDTWTSIYGHASKLLVRRGQAVRRGQVIALSGDTGFADQPEVHFELRRGRTPVDPIAQLPRR